MLGQLNIAAPALLFDNPNMAGDGELDVYDALMKLKPEGLKLGTWATRAGLARNYFNLLREGSKPRHDTLEKLLDAIGVSWVQYDAARAPGALPTVMTEVAAVEDNSLSPFNREPEGQRVPLVGSAVGGNYGDIDEHVELTELYLGEVLEWLGRPPELRNDPLAYALRVVGDSMVPVFEPGAILHVSPQASLGIGDNVIVQLRGPDEHDDRVKMVLLKRLVRRGPDFIELRQFNPDIVFKVPLGRIVTDSRGRVAMHRVSGARF